MTSGEIPAAPEAASQRPPPWGKKRRRDRRESAIPTLPSTVEIEQLAKDARALARARESAAPRLWTGLGRSPRAVWGACRGSAVYSVAFALEDRVGRCSCPSHQFPCRHVVALLLLADARPGDLPEATPPDDVAGWLERRAAKAGAAKQAPAPPPDPEAQKKRAEARQERIRAGATALDRWLSDLVTHGLASLSENAAEVCRREAARLVDAQAPGLAARVKVIGELVEVGLDWPERVLDALGHIALLSRAAQRLDRLDPVVADDVRDALGWTVRKDEVLARGERQVDLWQVVAQVEEVDDDDLRQQRSWLTGAATGRQALIVQFAFGSRPFPVPIAPGTAIPGELAFWPGAQGLRALFAERSDPVPLPLPLPGYGSIASALDAVADRLAACPWHDRFGLTLTGVVPTLAAAQDGGGWLVDGDGAALPFAGGDPWTLLALSGGHPVDVVGEWRAGLLTPLAAVADGAYHRLPARGGP